MEKPWSGRCKTVCPWKPTTAIVLAVWAVAGRPEPADRLAIGLDQRHVHAVIGGAAHQADGGDIRHEAVLGFNPAPDLLHPSAATPHLRRSARQSNRPVIR